MHGARIADAFERVALRDPQAGGDFGGHGVHGVDGPVFGLGRGLGEPVAEQSPIALNCAATAWFSMRTAAETWSSQSVDSRVGVRWRKRSPSSLAHSSSTDLSNIHSNVPPADDK